VLEAADVTFVPLDVTSFLQLTLADVARLAQHTPAAHLRRRSAPAAQSSADAPSDAAPAAGSAAAAGAVGAAGALLLGFVEALVASLVATSLNFKQTGGDPAMLLHDAGAVSHAHAGREGESHVGVLSFMRPDNTPFIFTPITLPAKSECHRIT
jgi:hypothetical protein